MAKDYPYFKFFVSEWSDGDIALEDMEVQGLFVNLCAYYWSNECDVELEKIRKKFKGFDHLLNTLFDIGIIKKKGGKISINFLDEQRIERMTVSEKNANNVSKRWKNNDGNTTVIRPYKSGNTKSIQLREEKRREDKRRKDKKGFTPPTLEEVKNYFQEKGYTQSSAVRAYDYYSDLKWVDSQGNQVKSWKAKMNSVWFKDENKQKTNGEIATPKTNTNPFIPLMKKVQ